MLYFFHRKLPFKLGPYYFKGESNIKYWANISNVNKKGVLLLSTSEDSWFDLLNRVSVAACPFDPGDFECLAYQRMSFFKTACFCTLIAKLCQFFVCFILMPLQSEVDCVAYMYKREYLEYLLYLWAFLIFFTAVQLLAVALCQYICSDPTKVHVLYCIAILITFRTVLLFLSYILE